MEELERILRAQAAERPWMEPTDGVKLIYQNEFGGGHLIRDRGACMAYLIREHGGVPHDPGARAREPIGNGMVRVNLAAVPVDRLEALGEAFIRSAGEHRGSMASFLDKLELLKALTGEGIFSFDVPALEAYLEDYRQAGYPAVSHSEAYQRACRPAYRVVCDRLWQE